MNVSRKSSGAYSSGDYCLIGVGWPCIESGQRGKKRARLRRGPGEGDTDAQRGSARASGRGDEDTSGDLRTDQGADVSIAPTLKVAKGRPMVNLRALQADLNLPTIGYMSTPPRADSLTPEVSKPWSCLLLI